MVMSVFVCDRYEAVGVADSPVVSHVISINDPGQSPPEFVARGGQAVLVLEMNDVLFNDTGDHSTPSLGQIESALRFAATLKDGATMVVHCTGGVSRSTALAIAILVQKNGAGYIDEAIKNIKAQRGFICPNPIITLFADDVLGLEGSLHEACEAEAIDSLWNKYAVKVKPVSV